MHILLGFDLRKCAGEYLDGFWLSEHRNEYLLRPDVQWPLSVDAIVWPSIFDLTAPIEYRSSGAIKVAPTTPVQLGVKLWDDHRAMEREFAERGDGTSVVRVAVELCLDHPVEEDSEWNFLAGSLPSDDQTVHEWTSAGYDVADRYLLSGLMNCGYTEHERAELGRWATALNGFGLFDDVEAAEEFRRLTETRVPEHSPFFVYRLLANWKRMQA